MARAPALAAAVFLLLPLAALADSFSGYIEETVATGSTENTDSSGATQRLDTAQWTQRYRLALDRSFFPTLRLSAGGLFERAIADNTSDGVDTSFATRSWSAYGNLSWTLPTLALGTGYARREAWAGGPLGLINEQYNLMATWRPEGLPVLFLRFTRPLIHDSERTVQDLRSVEALASATWSPVRQIGLDYSVSYANPHDYVRGSDTTTWLQTGRAAYSDRVLGGRTSLSVSGSANRRITEIAAAGSGTFATLQAPIAGFSLIETGIATRERDTLTPNAAVINGDLTATAGINLGTSASTPTADYRDIGAQFADAVTPVNTLYVWVDRDLSPEVAQALRFEVWKSDDNLDWTQVTVLRQFSAQFVTLQDRFEITIDDTRARYLKVVARPVAAGVTTDRRFADIFVTELQLLLVEPLPRTRRVDTANAATLSASARTLLLPAYNFSHDISLYLSAQQRPALGTATVWLVLNGLSASRQLNETLLASARVARQDGDQLRGHEVTWLYSASLAATPLPTLTSSLIYGGQVQQTQQGNLDTNTLSLFTQATPYQGIGLVANLSYGIARNLIGQTLYTDVLTLTGSVQPHPKLSFAGSFGHTGTIAEGAGRPRSSTVINRLDGTVTFAPVHALFASLTVSRVVQRPRPATLASAALGFNPFPGGDLQFGATYNETLDADDSRTRFFGPFLRWNIRRGTTLNLSYTILDTDRHAQGRQLTRTLSAILAIPL